MLFTKLLLCFFLSYTWKSERTRRKTTTRSRRDVKFENFVFQTSILVSTLDWFVKFFFTSLHSTVRRLREVVANFPIRYVKKNLRIKFYTTTTTTVGDTVAKKRLLCVHKSLSNVKIFFNWINFCQRVFISVQFLHAYLLRHLKAACLAFNTHFLFSAAHLSAALSFILMMPSKFVSKDN